MKVLLDTCVISELVSKKPNAEVLHWVSELDERNTFLSVITIGEIQAGIEKLRTGTRKEKLEEWLRDDLRLRFANKIVPIDEPIMLTWGTLIGALKRKGKSLPVIDSLIAATAVTQSMVLATRNVIDFANTGVELTNPWAP